MMLVTNKPVEGKGDAAKIVRCHFLRWSIEEYFGFKKQHYGFEDFRERSLKAINTLNRFVSFAIGLLSTISQKDENSRLMQTILAKAMALKNEVSFLLYQYGYGVMRILA